MAEASLNQWQGVAEFTDANGHYTLPGLSKGDYEIEFLPYELNYVTEYYDNQRSEEEATFVHLAEGKAAELSDFAEICTAVPA